jgi:hypothetical protein
MEMIQANGVDDVVLHVNGVQRSRKFYIEVLGKMTGRLGQDRCINFRDPDGHRLQLMVPG